MAWSRSVRREPPDGVRYVRALRVADEGDPSSGPEPDSSGFSPVQNTAEAQTLVPVGVFELFFL